MQLLSKTLALLSLLLFSQTLYADEQPASSSQQSIEELKAAIEKIRKDTNTPALGIALVNKDGPYWLAGLGEANVEQHIKADENTMYPIASISKMFVALSILKLVEEGKLHLNDKVHDLVPEIQYENKWEKTNPILLVHLLEHTTGWDELHMAEIAFEKSDATSLKSALNFHPDSRTSRWMPGTRYAYNTIGPAVAAYIVETFTGKKFEDYVQENFFTPLAMNTTSYYKSNQYDKYGAVLYTNGIPEKYNFQQYRPSGAINSSTKEMANLLQFFIQRGEFAGQKLLNKASIDRMEKPTSTLGAVQGIAAGYGLYNFTKGYEDFGYAFHGHDGGGSGSASEMMYSSALGEGYVIMANTNNGSVWQISQLLTRYLLNNSQKKIVAAVPLSAKLNSLSGIYVQLNPRIEIMRFSGNVLDAIKISVSDNKIHRSPIFGGWESSDYAISENLLINPWTGLPSIALVNDPSAGETLQIEGDLYKRIPSVVFYGGITLFLFLVAFTVANIIFVVIWLPRMLLGKLSKGPTIKIRTWPLLASLAIITAFLLIALYGVDMMMLGRFTWVSVSVFISSLLYPILTTFSLLSIYKYRTEPIYKLAYWNAVIFSILHALFSIYLTYYGIIGFRGWAE